MRYVLLGSLLLTLVAYATSESEQVKDLARCWDRSHELMASVEPDEMGNSFSDPAYQKKQANDARCYAIQRDIAKKHKRQYACYYHRETMSYKCKEDKGGWK